MGKCTRGGLTPQSVTMELRGKHVKLQDVILRIGQMYQKGVIAPCGWVSGWVAPDSLEYLTSTATDPSGACVALFSWLIGEQGAFSSQHV